MFDAIKKYSLWFLILVYFCGSIGFAIRPDFFRPFTPLTLLFTSLVFLAYQSERNLTYLSTFITIAIFGFVAELIGVKSGFVFGRYSYGEALGYKWQGVPLVISLNWALLISTGVLLTSSISNYKILNALCSAFIITATDFLIEHVCVQLDMWYFESGLAGLQNYLAWFLISFICSFGFYKVLSKGNKKVALTILLLQIFFFGIIYILNLL